MTTKLPTWSVYRYLDNEERERIHTKWCHDNKRDPNSDSDCNDFFDEIDKVPETPTAPAETQFMIKSRGRPRKEQNVSE